MAATGLITTWFRPPRTGGWAWWATFRAVLRRQVHLIQSRRQLALADDRMLADIGISRAQARFEASRPWWDAEPPAR